MSVPSPLSAGDMLRLYNCGQLSPTEVLEATLARIESLDGELSAFRTVLSERARAEASARTEELRSGQPAAGLHGIPVAVKELIDVAGAPASRGSRVLAGRRAHRDAAVVERLRRAGAVIVGLTRSHEFGWGITSQHELDGGTRNPWNTGRVPGGSSGGSAAAVAAGMVPVALGSDTGGSIRIPASFCGVAGLKPTFGSVSVRGVAPLAPSLDHVGPIAARVDDLWRMWEVIRGPGRPAGPAGPDSAALLAGAAGSMAAGLRIGLAPGLNDPPLAADIARCHDAARSALADLGCTMIEVDLGPVKRIRSAFSTIQMAEAYHVHSRVLSTFPAAAQSYGPDVRMRLEQARNVSLAEYLSARLEAAEIRQAFAEVLADVDVLLTPVSAGGPSAISSPDRVTHLGQEIEFRDLVMNFTTPQDLTGLPACSVAVGLDDDGMPVGVQLTAADQREDLAVRVAAALQQALPLPPPPLLSHSHI